MELLALVEVPVVSIRRGKGYRLVRGTRLVVFPRPNRPQVEKVEPGTPLEPEPLAPYPFLKRRRRGGYLRETGTIAFVELLFLNPETVQFFWGPKGVIFEHLEL